MGSGGGGDQAKKRASVCSHSPHRASREACCHPGHDATHAPAAAATATWGPKVAAKCRPAGGRTRKVFLPVLQIVGPRCGPGSFLAQNLVLLICAKSLILLAPLAGFEPATNRLTAVGLPSSSEDKI